MQTINVEISLGSLVEGREISSVMTHIMLSRSYNLVLWVIKEFVPMGKPADNSRDHEKNGEHIGGETHCLVDDATVKIDIWIQFPFDKVLITQCNLLKFHSNLDEFFFASDLENLISNFLHYLGSRIIALINSMSESIK